MRELPDILKLDVAGNPQRWINHEKAAYYYTKGLVAWSLNVNDITLNGGISRMTGERSFLTMDTIIAVRNQGKPTKKQFAQLGHVPLKNKFLFRRDRYICAYCGGEFSESGLTCDHVHPQSKGGKNIWENVVSACGHCNKHKDNHTLEQAGLQLLYVPYKPNLAEYLILKNRNILADQMEFLMARVTKESRLHLS